MTERVLPWYDHAGWLGVKHQVSHLLLPASLKWYDPTGWLGVKCQVSHLFLPPSLKWHDHTGWLGVKHQVSHLLLPASLKSLQTVVLTGVWAFSADTHPLGHSAGVELAPPVSAGVELAPPVLVLFTVEKPPSTPAVGSKEYQYNVK